METKEVARVLIVDDVEANRFVLRDIINSMGYMPILAENGEQALKIADRCPLELVILDVAMPVMDGYEVCATLKQDVKTKDIPIIFISAFDEAEDIVKGFAMGGEDYVTKPFIPEVVKARVRLHLRLSETSKTLTEMNRKLQTSVNAQLSQMEAEKKNVLYALGRVARENASYAETNMERVGQNCKTMSEAMQLSNEFGSLISDSFISTIELAAPLCDIGNMAIPTGILQKGDSLVGEEYETMKTHTLIGAKILKDIQETGGANDFLKMSMEIANYHHENWDGTGYPSGISGNEIPLAAQIVAVVSGFCAMTEKRVYRDIYTVEEALNIMDNESGTKYNPAIVAILKKIYRQLC
ncbi:MAG: response regulator [Lachnospiraceae bacterium]|nr:response regulator [Lachnospiraceae bacterium]